MPLNLRKHSESAVNFNGSGIFAEVKINKVFIISYQYLIKDTKIECLSLEI
jgi:hypothetical protein